MPTQKTFKRRVRTRMTKTGESYTTARLQLLRKAAEPEAPEPQHPTAPEPAPEQAAELLTSDDAMRRATGKGHDEWFAILDAWGARDRTHTEIARWVNGEHGVPGWWAQNVTVNYERARGMRAPNQVVGGFNVSVTRTVNADPDRVLAAFNDPAQRAAWLPEPMTQRPTKAARSVRFDWPDPPSRVILAIEPKADGRSIAAVVHEKLADRDAVAKLRPFWRARLDALKSFVER